MVTMSSTLLVPAGAPDARAATDGTTDVGYAELSERVAGLADRLVASGLDRGARIATLAQNSLDQVVLFYACARAGLTLVPLSWRATPTELAVMLSDAEPVLLATDADHQDLAARACRAAGAAARSGAARPRRDRAPRCRPGRARRSRPVRRRPAVLLIYTSGSSGRPKGVPLSQANCAATNAAFADALPARPPEDTVLLVLPQFHVAAWNVQPLLAWSVGARGVVVSRFDAGRRARHPRARAGHRDDGRPDHLPDARGRARLRRAATCLGTALRGRRRRTGRRATWAWPGGATASGCGPATGSPRPVRTCSASRRRRPGPPAGWSRTPASRCDWTTPVSCWCAHRGCSRATGATRRRPNARFVDGWLATGDFAEERDGRFRLRGRVSEKYISGGENVHPAEVEHALRRVAGVAEAAVVGVPDERWGEAGLAFVVPEAGCELEPEQVRRELREHLAGFKVPRQVVVVRRAARRRAPGRSTSARCARRRRRGDE